MTTRMTSDSTVSGSADAQSTQEISRRELFRGVTLMVGGVAVLATTVTPQRAEAGQMTQKAAGYQATPKGDQRCDNCNLFQPPSACKFVAGEISPSGWCRLYARKTN